MNDQEGKDYSEWSGYFAAEVVFYGNKTIKQMISDLQEELKQRKSTDENK